MKVISHHHLNRDVLADDRLWGLEDHQLTGRSWTYVCSQQCIRAKVSLLKSDSNSYFKVTEIYLAKTVVLGDHQDFAHIDRTSKIYQEPRIGSVCDKATGKIKVVDSVNKVLLHSITIVRRRCSNGSTEGVLWEAVVTCEADTDIGRRVCLVRARDNEGCELAPNGSVVAPRQTPP